MRTVSAPLPSLGRPLAHACDGPNGFAPMAYFEFIWLDAVVEKLAGRDIPTDEVEAIIGNPEGQDRSRCTGLPVAFGRLADGRFLIVVYR